MSLDRCGASDSGSCIAISGASPARVLPRTRVAEACPDLVSHRLKVPIYMVKARLPRAADPRRPRDRAGSVLTAAGFIAADSAQHQILAAATRSKNLYFVRLNRPWRL